MTAKNIRCAECRFCENGWCKIKALRVTEQSVRSCKVYAKRQAAS